MMHAMNTALFTLAISALRTIFLAGIAAVALSGFRAKSTSARIFVWRAVLMLALAMPFLGQLVPPLSIPTPAFAQLATLQPTSRQIIEESSPNDSVATRLETDGTQAQSAEAALASLHHCAGYADGTAAPNLKLSIQMDLDYVERADGRDLSDRCMHPPGSLDSGVRAVSEVGSDVGNRHRPKALPEARLPQTEIHSTNRRIRSRFSSCDRRHIPANRAPTQPAGANGTIPNSTPLSPTKLRTWCATMPWCNIFLCFIAQSSGSARSRGGWIAIFPS